MASSQRSKETGANPTMATAFTHRLPPPPSMPVDAVAATNRNSRHPFKLQPVENLQPLCYKNANKRLVMRFPHPTDLQLKLSYTGDGDVQLHFLPVLWGFMTAIKTLGRQFPNVIQLNELDDVYYPKCTSAHLRYATFVLTTNSWPDDAFKNAWLQYIVPAIESAVRQNFSLPDFEVEDVCFEFLPSLVTPEIETFGGHAFNDTELINLFLEEEFEFTFQDEARSNVTVQGVEYHLHFLWIPESKSRRIDITALIQEHKVTAKRLREIITSRQIPIALRGGDALKGKVQVARRRKGRMNYMQEEEERATECYIGMRYKRQIECDRPVDSLANHIEVMVKSVLSENSLQQPSKSRQKPLSRVPKTKAKKPRLTGPFANGNNGTASTSQQ